MYYVRYALFCFVSAAAFSASPQPAQTPIYEEAEKGLVVVQPESGHDFTRLRFMADSRYYPEVKRRGSILRITLDGGARFAPMDAGANDKRIRALRTNSRGTTLEILLKSTDTDTRVYFSESASGIDIIDCPCPGRPSLQERAHTDVNEVPGIPGAPEDDSFFFREYTESLQENLNIPQKLDVTRNPVLLSDENTDREPVILNTDEISPKPVILSDENTDLKPVTLSDDDISPEPVLLSDERKDSLPYSVENITNISRSDGIYVYEQTAFEDMTDLTAVSSSLQFSAPSKTDVLQSFPPMPELTAISNAIGAAYASLNLGEGIVNDGAAVEHTPAPKMFPVKQRKISINNEQPVSEAVAVKKKTKQVRKDPKRSVSFVWPRKPSLAFFKRSDRYWLVVSAGIPLNNDDILTSASGIFSSFAVIDHPNYRIYHGRKKNNVAQLALSSEKTDDGYRVTVAAVKKTPELTKKINVITETSKLAGSGIRIKNMPLIPPLRMFDPIIGDELLIMTGYRSGRGNAESRVFPDFALLATSQGAVAELRSDQVVYEFSGGDIVIAGPTNRLAASAQSKLSELREQERQDELEKNISRKNTEISLLKFHSWRRGGDEKFTESKQELMQAISSAPLGLRSEARLALAHFYFSHGLEIEAGGALGVLGEHDPAFAARPEVKLLAGAARYLAGDYEGAKAAFKDFDTAVFKNPQEQAEAALWKKLADIKLYNIVQMPERYLEETNVATTIEEKDMFNSGNRNAESSKDNKKEKKERAKSKPLGDDDMPLMSELSTRQKLSPQIPELSSVVDGFMSFYPIDIYNDIILTVLNTHLLSGNIVKSDAVATMLKREDTRSSFINSVNIMAGVAVAQEGDSAGAIKYWEGPSDDIRDPKNRTLARFLTAYLANKDGLATVKETIDRLNAICTAWRGGVLELNALKTVGELYFQQDDYMRGFEAWRVAANNLTQYPVALDLAAQLSDKFMNLLGHKEHPSMSQFDMLTLFYEFRELVPVGDAGDKIISTLADRLISVDLLSRASALLTHQVQYRLHGEQRDEAIFKLVDIHMRNNRYDLALKVLKSIEAKGENADKIRRRVKYLSAFALIEMNLYNKALKLLRDDHRPQAVHLRTEIYWRNRVWKHIINELAPMFRELRREKNSFTKEESIQMVRLAVAYALLDQRKYLKILREDFGGHIEDPKQQELFNFITLDRGDVNPDRLDYSLEFAEINTFMKQYEQNAPSGASN